MAQAIPFIQAGMSAMSSWKQGQASSAAAEANAKLAEQNAQITEAQKVSAMETQQRTSQKQLGETIASFGASGAALDVGSVGDVIASNVQEATMDRLNLEYNYNLKSQNYRNQAAIYSAEAENSSTSGVMGGVMKFFSNSKF